MPKYRDVTDEPQRFVICDYSGSVREVTAGQIVNFPDDWPYYIQTGEQGETPMWELVESTQSDTSKGEK